MASHKYPKLKVEELQQRILDKVAPREAETVPILESLGRVLVTHIHSDMDVPPLDNSAMDGYAVRGDDLKTEEAGKPIRFRIIGDLPAGNVFEGKVGSGEAVRIMTGAPVPSGADTVVRFEDTSEDEDYVQILEPPRKGKNVRKAGEDVREGAVVLSEGAVLRPQEMGMLASVGKTEVKVVGQPKVGLLATGDEVVDIDEEPPPGKIRNINSFTNAAQVTKYGGIPIVYGIAKDKEEDLVARIRQAVDEGVDILVTSGGVSVGDFDLVKQVLASEGKIDFWWVNMKPGKPMAFGEIDGIPLFGLPGNPVSAMISFELFVRPTIRKMLGYTDWGWQYVDARLADPITRKDSRRHYLRVKLQETDSGLDAKLTGDQGSGILSSLVRADGLAIIPEDTAQLSAGSKVKVLLLD